MPVIGGHSGELPQAGHAQQADRVEQTAEDILRDIIRIPPDGGVILPEGRRPVGAAGPALLPEGHPMVQTRGCVDRREGWWVFVPLEPLPRGPSELRLLPNSFLESLASVATHASQDQVYIVSGRTTIFAGRNYLLLAAAARDVGGTAPPPRQEPLPDAVPGDSGAQGSSADSLLDRVRQAKPRQDTIAPETQRSPSDAAGQTKALLPEDSAVARRRGRLLREDEWWVFHFDNDQPESPEPSFRVLPCSQLQAMVNILEMDSTESVFILSGNVTLFEGRNYLLPRLVLKQSGLGTISR